MFLMMPSAKNARMVPLCWTKGLSELQIRNIIKQHLLLNHWSKFKIISQKCSSWCLSTLDKQCICVNTQLKSSKKQLKWNMCMPISNSNDGYAITCEFIAYHLVHFVSIRLIKKCQSGIDFIFTSERNILQFYENILAQSSILRKNTKMKVKLCKVYTLECQQGDEICFRYNKIRKFDTLERQKMVVNKYASTFPMASCNKKRCNHRKRKRGVKNMKICNCFCKYAI